MMVKKNPKNEIWKRQKKKLRKRKTENYDKENGKYLTAFKRSDRVNNS